MNVNLGFTELLNSSRGHKINISLNTLVMSNDTTDQTFSNNVLEEIKDIKFAFSSDSDANISMDNIRFEAEIEE